MPVSLLDVECGIVNTRCLHDLIIMPAILITPMAATHNHTHRGKSIDGRTNIAEQTTNTRSAALSILDPSSLSAFTFLAIAPSIISEIPPRQYNTQNGVLNTGKNSIASAATPLDADNMFGTAGLTRLYRVIQSHYSYWLVGSDFKVRAEYLAACIDKSAFLHNPS